MADDPDIRLDVWHDDQVYRVNGRAVLYAVLRHPDDMDGMPAIGLRATNRADLVLLAGSLLTMLKELGDDVAREAIDIARAAETRGPSRGINLDVIAGFDPTKPI